MSTNRTGEDFNARRECFFSVYRGVTGLPKFVTDEQIAEAALSEGIDLSAMLGRSEFGPAPVSNFVRCLLGFDSHSEARGVNKPSLWRELRREFCGTLTILKALAASALRMANEPTIFRSEIGNELKALNLQLGQMRFFTDDAALRSAMMYQAIVDPIGSIPESNLDLIHFKRTVDSMANPRFYIDLLADLSKKVQIETSLGDMAMPDSAHAFSVVHAIEEIILLAESIATESRPIRLSLSFNRLRDTIDVDTSDEDILVRMIRQNPSTARYMRECHDGWWIEGSRIAIPIKPFGPFSLYEGLQQSVWEKSLKIDKLVLKVLNGAALSEDEKGDWNRLKHRLSEILEAMVSQYHFKDHSIGTSQELDMARCLVGKVVNDTTMFSSCLPDASCLSSGDSVSASRIKNRLRIIIGTKFPWGTGVFERISRIFQADDVNNFQFIVNQVDDVVPSAHTQYGIHRLIDGIFVFSGLLAAGSREKISLCAFFKKGALDFTDAQGIVAKQFFRDDVLTPKIVHEIKAWAKHVSSDGMGLVADERHTGMGLGLSLVQGTPVFHRDELLDRPVYGSPIMGYARTAMRGGLLTFYPTALTPFSMAHR